MVNKKGGNLKPPRRTSQTRALDWAGSKWHVDSDDSETGGYRIIVLLNDSEGRVQHASNGQFNASATGRPSCHCTMRKFFMDQKSPLTRVDPSELEAPTRDLTRLGTWPAPHMLHSD